MKLFRYGLAGINVLQKPTIVYLASVFCIGLIYGDFLNKQLSFQNIHSNCLICRQLLFIDKNDHDISVMGVKHIDTFLLFSIFYYFKISKATFAKREETKFKTEN